METLIILCTHACQSGGGYGPSILIGLLLMTAPAYGLYLIHKNDEWDQQAEEIRSIFGLKPKEEPYEGTWADECHRRQTSGEYDMFGNKYKDGKNRHDEFKRKD